MLTNEGINLLEQFLNSRLVRNEVISSNIANANTPGYKARDVAFTAHLDEASRIFGNSEPAWEFESKQLVNKNTMREDGNSVQMEMEMAHMIQNSAEYMAGVKFLTRQIGMIKYAIQGGR